MHNTNFCCFATFLYYKPFCIRMKRLPTKADLIDLCPHCLIVKQLTARLEVGGRLLPQELAQLEQKKKHKENAWLQTMFYIEVKKLVLNDKNITFVIHDFCKISFNGNRYNVLMITVLTYNEQRDTHEWIYLDFMEQGTGSNQDFYFVRSVWMFLLGLSDLGYVKYNTSSPDIDVRSYFLKTKIIIFSDGAGQHFKQKKKLSLFGSICNN